MLHIAYSSISSVLLLVLAPYLIGEHVCDGIDIPIIKNGAFRFVSGFVIMLAIWEIMAMPFTIVCKDEPFHYLCLAYLALIAILCVTSTVCMVISKRKPLNIKLAASKLVTNKSDAIYNLVFLIVAGGQFFQTMYYAPVGYIHDDSFYYAGIYKTVYMDLLQMTGLKLTMATWYAFLSFVVSITKIHPLIICRTIIPAYIIVLIYFTMYIFAQYIYSKDRSKIMPFLTWTAIILEVFSYTYYLFFLSIYITTWGKQIAGMIGVPLLMLSTCMITSEEGTDRQFVVRKGILLASLGMGTASFSVAASIAGAVGVFCMSITYFVILHRRQALIYGLAAGIPFLVQLAVYFMLISH